MTRTYPIFALAASTVWDDLLNAMEAYIQYEMTTTGQFTPLFLFAPMTEPDNPDAWEPLKTIPENCLVISISRDWDPMILEALEHEKETIGLVRNPGNTSVCVNRTLPISDVYRQMNRVEINVYNLMGTHPDDPSFFFLRGEMTVRAFDKGLRHVTRDKE
jgi:hypothetical protein